jgi:hypothetical protein
MRANNWTAQTSNADAFKRASGRRQYNARRHRGMLRRREIVALLLNENPYTVDRGVQKAIAEALHSMCGRLFHPSTISRDVAALRQRFCSCPVCGTRHVQHPRAFQE